jgi:hypothetical protein
MSMNLKYEGNGGAQSYELTETHLSTSYTNNIIHQVGVASL